MDSVVKQVVKETFAIRIPQAKPVQSREDTLKYHADSLDRDALKKVISASYQADSLEIKRSGTGLLIIIK